MSFESSAVCKRIIRIGLHADMLKHLSAKTLSAETLNDPKSQDKRDFVRSHVAILCNVMGKTDRSTSRDAFIKCQAIDILSKFCNVTEYQVVFHTCFTMNLSQ